MEDNDGLEEEAGLEEEDSFQDKVFEWRTRA